MSTSEPLNQSFSATELSTSKQLAPHEEHTTQVVPPTPDNTRLRYFGYCVPGDFFTNYKLTYGPDSMHSPSGLLRKHIGHWYIGKVMVVDPCDGSVPPHCQYPEHDRVLIVSVMDNLEFFTVPTEAQFKKLEQLTGQKPRWWAPQSYVSLSMWFALISSPIHLYSGFIYYGGGTEYVPRSRAPGRRHVSRPANLVVDGVEPFGVDDGGLQPRRTICTLFDLWWGDTKLVAVSRSESKAPELVKVSPAQHLDHLRT
ncbi:hypothetical protein BJ138DRAFT_1104923 [Hygrophoropsis aurantiaca]|uniref:Uncharacterized protein n=1 Tax=Hygrophoropsis aurantiaca TaxID=72124 RepID=A0ACB7ZZZ6_9AGAM|nr:hypothetical protein BJ138DRAFT_1104923 [Hygrophoropsis aurantiaca]